MAVLLVSAALFHPAVAAQSDTVGAFKSNSLGDFFTVDGWKKVLSGLMLDIASLFLRITLFFLTFIIEISAYNGYLDAPAVTVGWVMVRDITNMFFVVIMLLIAFGTILGIEQYEWKKLLIKFILAAIFVNFSRVICGVFIDISQVVMQTFVNGIAATAGGNLINIFNLDGITKLAGNNPPETLQGGLFSASVMAVTFAGMVMMTMGIFVFMLAARVIRLWVLIVLSPLAFVLSVIPLTQKFASQWWSEFGDDLVTGPVLLFFIWLSFVSLGSGKISEHFAANSDVPEKISDTSNLDANNIGNAQSAGISTAMSWNNMANFIIAIGMLFAGAQVASQIGGSSGSALTRVTDFGKKVATIASGVAVGQWLHEHSVPKKAGFGLLKGTSRVTGLTSLGQRVGDRVMGHLGGAKARALAPAMRYKTEIDYEPDGTTAKRNDDGSVKRKRIIKKDAAGQDTGEFEMEANPDYNEAEHRRGFFGNLARGNVVGAWASKARGRYQKEIEAKKMREKTENFAKNREELMRAQTRGVPKSIFFENSDKVDALDRIEQGMLEGEKLRSAAKTAEYGAIGRNMILENPRFQNGKFQNDRGTMAEVIGRHKEEAAARDKKQETLLATARNKVRGEDKTKQAVEARVKAELELKAQDALTKKQDSQTKLTLAATTGGEAVAAAVAAERAAHTAEEAVKAVETGKLAEYLTTKPAGIAELTEEAAIKQAIEETEAVIKAAEAQKRAAYLQTGEGQESQVKQAQAVIGAGTSEAEIAEEQARAKTKAQDLEPEALVAAEEAKVRTAAETGAQKRQEAEAGRVAAFTQAPAMLASQQEALKLAAAEKEKKEFEEAAKIRAQTTPEGADAMKRAAEAEVRTGAQTAEQKEIEEGVKAAAQREEQASLEAAKRAEVWTAAETADQKKQEEEAKKKATLSEAGAVLRAKEAEVQTAAETAETKQFEEEAKRLAAISQRAALDRTKRAEIKTGLSTAGTKEEEETAKAEAQDLLADTLTATKAAEIRSGEMTAAQKEKEEIAKRKAMEAERPSVERTQAAGIRTAAETGKISTIEARAKVEATKLLTAFIKETNLAEQGKAAADEFVKRIKNDLLKESFKDAAKEMKRILDSDKSNTDKFAELEVAASSDGFVAALKEQKLQTQSAELLGAAKARADAEADSGFVQIRTGGYRTADKSTAGTIKRTTEELTGLGQLKLAAVGADSFMHMARGGAHDEAGRLAALGVTARLSEEAYLDDAIGELARRYQALFSKGSANRSAAENADFSRMTEHFVDNGGIIKNINGEWHGVNSNEVDDTEWGNTVGYMQQYAATGGDIEYMKKFKRVEAQMKANPTKSFEAAAAVLGTDATAFVQQTKDNDSYTQAATDLFDKAGLATGHHQLLGNVIFDPTLSAHRPATAQEARDRQTSERAKSKVAAHRDAQYQAYGVVDASTGQFLKLSAESYASLTKKINSFAEAGAVKPRTVEALLDGKQGEDAVKDSSGAGYLGEQAGTGKRDAFFRNVLLTAMKTDLKAFAMLAAQRFKVERIQAEKGAIPLGITNDDGVVISGATVREFMTNLIQSQDFGLDDNDRAILQNQLSGYVAGLVTNNRGGRGDDGGDPDLPL